MCTGNVKPSVLTNIGKARGKTVWGDISTVIGSLLFLQIHDSVMTKKKKKNSSISYPDGWCLKTSENSSYSAQPEDPQSQECIFFTSKYYHQDAIIIILRQTPPVLLFALLENIISLCRNTIISLLLFKKFVFLDPYCIFTHIFSVTL